MKMRTARRGLHVCGVVFGLTGVLTGCGGGGATGPAGATPVAAESVAPVSAVHDAVEATTHAGSSRTRTTMTMQSGSRTVTMTGDGQFDYTRRVGQLEVTVPQTSGITGPLEEILTPDALYMKNATPGIPADKWVKIDVTSLADGNLVSGGATDPSTSFAMLLGVTDDVRLVGTDKVGTDTLRHYQGTLDIKKAYDAAPPNQRGALGAALKSFATTTIPFDAFLDQDGRLRKVQEEFSLGSSSKASAAPTARIISSAELYDFGVPVTVTAPAPADLYVAPGTPAPSAPPTHH